MDYRLLTTETAMSSEARDPSARGLHGLNSVRALISFILLVKHTLEQITKHCGEVRVAKVNPYQSPTLPLTLIIQSIRPE